MKMKYTDTLTIIVANAGSTNDRCAHASPRGFQLWSPTPRLCLSRFIVLTALRSVVPPHRGCTTVRSRYRVVPSQCGATYPATRMGRCQYHKCAMTEIYNFRVGDQKAVYCKLHAEDGMVNISSTRPTSA